jgi:phosphoribosylanthranilate isomerase
LFLKFCGFTRKEDAVAAAQLGVDAIGLVFYPKSLRKVNSNLAAEIAAAVKKKALVVGVFVDELEEVILKLNRMVRFDAVQLHGQERPENYKNLLSSGLKIIKAVHPEKKESFEMAKSWAAAADFILLDSYSQHSPGGTGRRFNPCLIMPYFDLGLPVILAGGINPKNVGEYLSLEGIFGLDISSGIEISPGIKAFEKMEKIIREVKGRK